jgi:hypothetical protein
VDDVTVSSLTSGCAAPYYSYSLLSHTSPFLPSFPSITSCSTRRISTPPILFSLRYRPRWALHILLLRLLLYTRLSGLFYEHCHSLRPKTSSFRAFRCPRHGRRPRVFRRWGRMGRTTFELHRNRNVACPYGNRSVGTSAREPSKLLRWCGGHRCPYICGWIRSRRSTRCSTRLSPKPWWAIRRTELRPSRPSSWSVRRKKLRPPRFYTDAVHLRTSHK